MEAGTLYEAYKSLLFSLAYRMLGSVMDSEDIVHDVFLDWERKQTAEKHISREIKHVKAYLCKMVTNRCIDYLRSAKHQREQYFGAWLPEPMVRFGEERTDHHAAVDREGVDPLQRLLLQDSLSVAYLIMLEQLSPIERAIFLLREVFAYSFEEAAQMVDKKPENCRQILSRAKKKLASYEQSSIYPSMRMQELHSDQSETSDSDRSTTKSDTAGITNVDGLNVDRLNVDRLNVDRMNVDRLNVDRLNVDRMNVDRTNVNSLNYGMANEAVLAQFMRYVTEGNIDGLMRIVAGNAVFTSDGGGKVQAAVHPVLGSDRVIRFVLGIAGKLAETGLTIELAVVNSQPGIVIFAGAVPYCTMAFAYEDGKVAAIYNTMNPDKLRHVRR
ncbi:hypothetical protein PAECIP111893_01425 [Paenibacillus plantiphilus]|uniref:RNA polymerase sigma-70 factor, ECF subfamily n=1 Tax=Paenibacillus plantiphilus TaxID=2905650 RepID=A0ABM9SFG7_9BACL|nr:sigma-70 family RNA polymerase sigma factor [Paenibacillus plantiphilus]CAH1200537.1 hypothetical protein PAECIP111893_01425 [Paenibacillus plantiphilus]